MSWTCHRCSYQHHSSQDDDDDDRSRCKICGSERKQQRRHQQDDAATTNKKQRTVSPLDNIIDLTSSSSQESPPPLSNAASMVQNLSSKEEEEEEVTAQMMAWQRNVWNRDSKEDLESWLESSRPSQFSEMDYEWIQVENADSKSPGYNPLRGMKDSFDSLAYQPTLDTIAKVIGSGKKVSSVMKTDCIKAISDIAKTQNCTVGKWMLFIKPQDADEQWEAIARATATGKLGCSAKINPTKDITQDAVCCIYTSNFDDKHDVQRVLSALQNMGYSIKSGYKPDFFTHLGIYQKNEWRLPPTLYSVKEVMSWGGDSKSGKASSAPALESSHAKTKKNNNIWNETSEIDLKAWLPKNRPSQFSESDYDWIQVENAVSDSLGYYDSKTDASSYALFDASAYQPALDKITETIQSGKRVSGAMKADCIKSLKQVARQQNVTYGKWMLWLEVDQVDEKWQVIARATAEGKLGCHSKIKPTKSTASFESIVCHIYTKDFGDKDEIRRVLLAIEDLGFNLRSGYKPEFFSLLGIQSKNEWRLPSTLYSVKDVKAWGKNDAD